MFGYILKKRTLMYNIKYINLSFSTTCKEQWDLVSSVCLERKPIITKDLCDIELKYSAAVNKAELEISFKSNHEIRMMKDKLFAEELKKKNSSIDIEQLSVQTAQEFEDSCNEELKNFQFAQRVTEEDCDVTSLNRKLKDYLVLIVQQKIGNQSKWVLPQGERLDGETMRQAAERVLKEKCGPNLLARFLGNAPCGFYKFRYPKNADTSMSVGMKIFFFKAQFLDGYVDKELCPDFQWLELKELSVLQEGYFKSVKPFLIESES